jgi:N-acetyl-gamma-glutamyl-phosphate reductase
MPEMEQVLSDITGRDVTVLFQPHLCPMDRGMLCSIYADPTGETSTEELTATLKQAYANAPFVRVREELLPATKYVSGTNFCDVAARFAKGKVIVFSALDNVIKGASGQAVENLNLMFGFDQATGLY